MRFYRRLLLACALACVAVSPLVLPSNAAAFDCCAINGGTCTISATIVHGQSGWTTPICGTTITGTNCRPTLDADATASSGHCLTIGPSVALNMNGKKLTCTSSECGNAVQVTNSGGGANAVTITNGDIEGCWAAGVVGAGSNTEVSEMLVDLAGSCTGSGGYNGIYQIPGDVDHVVVKNAKYTGISVAAGEDLSDVIVRDSGNSGPFGYGYGITLQGSGSALDNVLLLGNYIQIRDQTVTNATIQRSEIQNATLCNCQISSGCEPDINNCLTINNSTTPTFVDDAMIP